MGILKFIPGKYYLLRTLIDLSLFALSYALAYLLRFDFAIPADEAEMMITTLPIVIAFRYVGFRFFGLFKGEWRFSSIEDLFSIFKAVSVSSAAFIGAIFILTQFQGFPRSVFIIDWALLVLLAGGSRFIGRVAREAFSFHLKNAKRAMLIGDEEFTSSIIREARKNREKRFNVVALVDDNPERHGMRIHGVEVIGDRRLIPHIVAKKNIDEVIIAQPKDNKRDLWELIDYCRLANVNFKIIPYQQVTGYPRRLIEQVREIRLEDLIGRKPVACNLQEIQTHIEGRRVLITGAGGSIGSELSRQVAAFHPEEIILLDRAENSLFYIGLELSRAFPALSFKQIIADVMNRSLIDKILCKYQPDLIYHAAAHKHVPMMELNPAEAIKNNVLGTRNIAQAAIHNHVSEFIFISTDKAVKPVNFMGVSKRLGEIYTQALGSLNQTKFTSVRFGNVLGSSGSVVRLFKEQLERDRAISVTHPEATRYFMSISEAVVLILQATVYGKGGEIFILDMGDPVNIYDLARAMISLAKKQVNEDLKIVITGLRPGEKLHEELRDDGEECLSTPHEKIMAVNGGGRHDLVQLDQYLDELEKKIDEMDRYSIAEKLKLIIPGFQPMADSMLTQRR